MKDLVFIEKAINKIDKCYSQCEKRNVIYYFEFIYSYLNFKMF